MDLLDHVLRRMGRHATTLLPFSLLVGIVFQDLASAARPLVGPLAMILLMLALVRTAGGQHNLELADRIFRNSVAHVENAYRLSGRRAPAEPQLGNTAHVGTCTFCHYSGTERMNYSSVSGELHERLIKTRR